MVERRNKKNKVRDMGYRTQDSNSEGENQEGEW